MSVQIQRERPWHEENPNRGTRDQDIRDACDVFIKEFPLGTRLVPDDFDLWLERQGLLNIPANVSKKADAWKAHLQRRHEIKKKMTTFSTTTKIATPFVIETIAGSNGQWEVRSPQEAISLKEPGRMVQSLVNTKRKQIGYLMQSTDWEAMPPYMRMFAENLYRGIKVFARTIEAHGSGLDEQFDALRRDLEKLGLGNALKPVPEITNGLPFGDEDGPA